MPNTRSAEKQVRQSERRRQMNRRTLSRLRNSIKKLRRLLDERKLEEAQSALPQVYQVIDRSARKRVIHSNTAARYKSRLTKRLNQLKGVPEAAA
ncbi:MAG: 30S ribosomal protein S20 [Acidobacteria bacterium]|nr:30S ribosomal protein S20 [Acidobacteriota bacterium]